MLLLTSDQEVTTNDQHNTNGGQDEAGPVFVVFVAHETNATHWVSIHLWNMPKMSDCLQILPLFSTVHTLRSAQLDGS